MHVNGEHDFIARHWMSEHPAQRMPPGKARGTGGGA